LFRSLPAAIIASSFPVKAGYATGLFQKRKLTMVAESARGETKAKIKPPKAGKQ